MLCFIETCGKRKPTIPGDGSTYMIQSGLLWVSVWIFVVESDDLWRTWKYEERRIKHLPITVINRLLITIPHVWRFHNLLYVRKERKGWENVCALVNIMLKYAEHMVGIAYRKLVRLESHRKNVARRKNDEVYVSRSRAIDVENNFFWDIYTDQANDQRR